MSQRLVIPDTAFSRTKTKQRRPRKEDKQHLAFIRGLKCCLCGAPNPDPAHIRTASPLHGKRDVGMQEKSDDKWTVPLCRTHHDEQHAAHERGSETTEFTWWVSKGIDPFGLALSLHACSGDDDIAEGILNASRPKRSQ
jgi:hypothetical protein